MTPHKTCAAACATFGGCCRTTAAMSSTRWPPTTPAKNESIASRVCRRFPRPARMCSACFACTAARGTLSTKRSPRPRRCCRAHPTRDLAHADLLLLQLRIRELPKERLVVAQVLHKQAILLGQLFRRHAVLELLQQVENFANALQARGLDELTDLASRHS